MPNPARPSSVNAFATSEAGCRPSAPSFQCPERDSNSTLDQLDPPARRLGDNFREARLQSGLSQTMLARITGLHPSTIGRLERGDLCRPPQASTIRTICRTLGASSDHILRI